jgi:hypothetical protein
VSTGRDRESPWRALALVGGCAAIDSVTVAMLLARDPFPALPGVLVAAITHGVAVLLLLGLTRDLPSRRWLSAAALLCVPGAGATVAAAALVTRGRGLRARRRRRRTPRSAGVTPAAMWRLADALSPYDALERGDREEKRAAISVLVRRRDTEAIALLRRVAARPDADLALAAALALDEIGERAERRAGQPDATEVRHVAG